MSFLGSLEQLLGGAVHGVGNAIHGVEQKAVNNVTHPQNIVNNLAHDAQGAGNALHALLGRAPQPAPQQSFGAPLSTSVTSVPNVWGTAVAQNTADQQGYAPWFRNLVQSTNPAVGALSNPRAGADYAPGKNQPAGQIELRPQQLDPYTVTHEGLHAAFQRKTPLAQQAFARVAQQATPIQNHVLNSIAQLGNQLYGGQKPLTEVHSFLPQVGQNSPTQSYYQHYFSNPNFYQEPRAESDIADATGFNMTAPGYSMSTPQFSDWRDN